MMRSLLLSLALSLSLFWAGMAAAQTLSETTYRRLTRIHEHIGEEEYGEALGKLEKLLSAVQRDDYEHALVLQTYGFIYAQQSNYVKAADYFKRALALESLPEQQVESMKYNLGQFHVAVEQYREGIAVLEDYLRTAKNPVPPDARILLATAYAQINQFRKALPPLTQAISESKDPKEQWFQLKLALHFELKDYPSCANTLLEMIRRFPVKEEYWKQLSGMFLEIRKDAEALAILALAERQGFLDEGKEIVNLANLFLFLDIPYKAAKILDQGLRRDAVQANAKHYELLGNAWLGAKETDRAIAALEQASQRTEDGELVLRLAFLYLEKESWAQVLPTLERARQLGVKNPGNAALLQGIAAAELGRYEEAIRAFAEAKKHEDTREQAAAWQQHALGLQADAQSGS